MFQQSNIQLLPDIEPAPRDFFGSREEYEQWVESYRAEVKPVLDDLKMKLAMSWHESFSRGPYVSGLKQS